MSLAGEIVDGVIALVAGGMRVDAETRRAAKAAVRETVARATELDRRELLPARADAITDRHLARVRRIAGATIPIEAHAAHVEGELAQAAMPQDVRESIEALIAHARAAIGTRDTEPPDDRQGNGG